MITQDVPRIVRGHVYRPRQVVAETLANFVDALGGEDVRKILEYYSARPGRALDIALHHSRLESILSLIGEVLVILSLHAGIVGYIVQHEKISNYPWIPAFAPALFMLGFHVALQVYWTKNWFNKGLRAAFIARSKDDALRAGIEYYNSLVLRLVTPVLFFYPIAASLTLLWIQAPAWAWLFEVPAGVFTGWLAQKLYYARLLHTDFREWFSVFALDLDEKDADALRDARRGRGLHRRLWGWLERRGGMDVSHFEIFTLAQFAAVLIDGTLVMLELFLLESQSARLSVAIPICLGLFVVGYSHLRRYAFLNQSRAAGISVEESELLYSNHAETDEESGELSTQGLDDTSRILRRAMP